MIWLAAQPVSCSICRMRGAEVDRIEAHWPDEGGRAA